ncbi:Phosphoglycolate phosphatase [Pirellulimonas nuda]|uniref:Phosphoglycolate phosphatase n=1 Tax=Pirellulimonas nuda TaxID=2528009 RepID=A0A518DF11_9BACT|nr:haloacid dehalogenase-like hydrolase [Pirellulimonas nuda]QDU90063.1 Phosphoglycolate phosphatase [Pirellulimonas nuda]
MKACLFDIDGTLIQTGGAGQLAFAQTFAEDLGVPDLSSEISFSGRSDRAIAHDLFLAHGLEATDATWNAFLAGYTRRLPAALAERQGAVLPGVLPLIERLEAMDGVLVGLLTGNVVEGARIKLSHFGLWERFPFGGFGDAHCDRSAIAEAARAAARERFHRTDISPVETIVVIGDTEHDIRCARSIGAKAVAVPTGFVDRAALAAESPDLLVETLEDQEQIVAWLAA